MVPINRGSVIKIYLCWNFALGHPPLDDFGCWWLVSRRVCPQERIFKLILIAVHCSVCWDAIGLSTEAAG